MSFCTMRMILMKSLKKANWREIIAKTVVQKMLNLWVSIWLYQQFYLYFFGKFYNIFMITFTVYISHSLSRDSLYYIFNNCLPTLENKVVLDIGSRLGAVLYGVSVIKYIFASLFGYLKILKKLFGPCKASNLLKFINFYQW